MIQTEPNAAAAAAVSADRNIVIRPADADEAADLFRLIADNVETGHLLPRSLGEVVLHAPRFLVAATGVGVVGCAELARLGTRVVEVRIPHALCVHPRPAAVRPAGFLNRAPSVGAGEDRDRLPHVCLVPALRAVRGDIRSQAEGRSLMRMRVGHHE